MSLPRYPQYKDSGTDWLADVPDHWRIVPLWTLFRRTKRTGFEAEQLLSVYRDFGVVPKASRDDNNNKASDDLSVYQLVEAGDLAINKMKAWQGSVAISEYRGIVSPAYFIYEAVHHENSRYLHYLLRSPRYITGYLAISKGIRVNQWDLEPQYHSRMPVLLPPIEEQTAIATFLDRETSKIDALIAEQEKLLTLLAEKRQATISHAVTRGLNPDVPMKDTGVEWLGEVPEHWKVKQLRYIAKIARGASPRPAGDPQFFAADNDSDSNRPWVTVAEVTKDHLMYLTEVSEYLTPLGVENSQSFESGTLVFTNSGATLGVPKILSIDCCANDGIVAFNQLSANVDIRFLYSFLLTTTERLRTEMKQGGGQPNLNTGIVKDIFIAVPPVDEQLAIVDFVDSETTKLDNLKAKATRAIELLKERRSTLISAAVTGQIDVRNI